MPIEPSAISGINPSGNTQNVAVDANGRLIASSTSTTALASSTGVTVSSVSVSTTAAVAGTTYNTSRKGYTLYNQGNSAILVAYSTVAATTTYSLSLASGAYWEMPVPLSALPISVAVSTSLTGGTASVFVSELT